MTSLKQFWCFYSLTSFPSVSIVDFEKVNVSWDKVKNFPQYLSSKQF